MKGYCPHAVQPDRARSKSAKTVNGRQLQHLRQSSQASHQGHPTLRYNQHNRNGGLAEMTCILAICALLAPTQRAITFSNWRFQISPFWVESTQAPNLVLTPYERASARNSRCEIRPGIKSSPSFTRRGQPLEEWFSSEWTRVLAGRTPTRDWGRSATVFPRGIAGLQQQAIFQEPNGNVSYVKLIALNPVGSINSILYTADDRESAEASLGPLDAILGTVRFVDLPRAAGTTTPAEGRNCIGGSAFEGKDPRVIAGTPGREPVGAGSPGAAGGAGTAKMTGFNPETHGFRFLNDFRNSVFGPPIQVITKGLCGGMSYTAKDYFHAKVPIPTQDFRPAHSTTLQAYLYRRQETSLLQNLDKWANYDFNPFGSRTLEIFNWGLRERLIELKSFIDRGEPVPLGLKGTSGGYGNDHQVLAVGYDMGRYKGDVGDYKEDLKIFLYEPNYPGEIITMVADPAKMEFTYKEHPNVRWRSYFVDGKYARMTPPTVANPIDPQATRDGLVRALRMRFTTGNEELIGGYLHLNLTIVFHDGMRQAYPNISQGGRWLPKYDETVFVVLSPPRKLADIRYLELNTNSTKGPTGDRWDMDAVSIRAIGGGFDNSLAFKEPASSYKFQGLPLQIFPR